MNISAIGNLLTDLGGSIESFRRIIQKLDSILDKEFEAVGRSDIQELESITTEKVSCSQSMEVLISHLSSNFHNLGLELGCNKTLIDAQSGMKLDELMSNIFQSIEEAELSDFFSKSLEEIRCQYDLLKSERKRVFPKVESNSYLIRKLLQYHRETYSFWQAVAGESEAVYGSSGKAKAVTQRSILSVRT